MDLTPDAGLDFGTVTVGADSVPLIATLANTGLTTISNVQLYVAPSGVFTRVPGGTCPDNNPFALGPADTCTARVIFHPVGETSYTASLRSEASGANADDFSFPGTAFPMLVKNGQSQLLKLTCIPGAETARSATLVMSTNDPAHPTVSFNLQCTGIAPVDTASPWTMGLLSLLLAMTGVAALVSTRGRRGLAASHGPAGVSSASRRHDRSPARPEG